MTIDGHIFNLKSLARDTDNDESDYSVSYNNGKGDITIDFNLCNYNSR